MIPAKHQQKIASNRVRGMFVLVLKNLPTFWTELILVLEILMLAICLVHVLRPLSSRLLARRPRAKNQGEPRTNTFTAEEQSMPKDIFSSEPRRWRVFCQLVMAVQCCAEARRRRVPQHCTAMTNWPNTIQCLGSDDIMSLGIKSFATEGVGTKNLFVDVVPFF